jgi:mannose-1-phosphate guanylyltransferase
MKNMERPVFSVVMAGGQGTRLWPLSRESQPKQFLSLTADNRSLLQATVQRAIEAAGCLEQVLIVAHQGQAQLVKEQVVGLPEQNLLLEPFGRNTAACIGLAAFEVSRRSPQAVMAVFPSDHLYEGEAAWAGAVESALSYASQTECLVALGLPPGFAFTGYGYMKTGRMLLSTVCCPVFEVLEFVEKPPHELAQSFLESGQYLWNIGTFAWQVGVFLNALERQLPVTYARLAACGEDLADTKLLASVYEGIEDISVDYAVLEKENNVVVVRGDFRRIDVGTLASLDEILPVDKDNNAFYGDNLVWDSQGNIIFSEEGLVGLVGMRDMIVIHKGDVVLVCPKERAGEVKDLVRQLDKKGLQRFR